jgi:cytidylate kinase
MLTKNNISAFRVYLGASPEVRIKRVGLREGELFDEVRRHTLERQSSEAKRYKKYYNIDVEDKSVYDMIIDTDDLDPDQIVNRILEGIKEC